MKGPKGGGVWPLPDQSSAASSPGSCVMRALTRPETTRSSRLNVLPKSVFLLLSTFALTASASKSIRHEHNETVSRGMDEVLDVVLSTNSCAKGCKYYSPIAREVRLSYHSERDSFYKWIHIDSAKETKFFSHVRVSRSGQGAVVKLRTLTKERDGALIKTLEAKSHLPHDPIFDVATTEIRLTKKAAHKTEVKARASTSVSGFVAMFPGKVKSGMAKSFSALFASLRR